MIVVLNAVIGFVQAWRADQAMAALRQLAAAHATVLRGGTVQVVAASDLVPGDIVLLEAGNQIPADLRLIEIAQLQVDESALTGESVTVAKQTAPWHCRKPVRLATAPTWPSRHHGDPWPRPRIGGGHGHAHRAGQSGTPARQRRPQHPLQLRLAAFGKRLALAVLAICAIVLRWAYCAARPLLMALTAISLAVAAIPEALPAVVTVLLALGARRMVAVHALVRRLPSVETLGR